MPLALRIKSGDLTGRLVVVEEQLVVGRAPTCDLSVADQRLSRRHARFVHENGVLYVEDLGSPNGTIVNGARAREKTKLALGDKILLGKTEMIVVVEDDEQPTQPPGVPRAAQHAPKLIKFVDEPSQPDLESMHAADFLAAYGLDGATQLDARQDVFDLVLRRARNFAILHGVGRAIQHELDQRAMLSRVLDLTLEVTEADRGYVALMQDGGALQVVVVRGTRRAAIDEVVISQSVSEEVIGRRCAVICTDPTADERFQDAASLMLSETRSLMAVPILVQNRVLGLLQVESGHLAERFTEADLDLLSMIASTAGVALDNLQLGNAREKTIRELEDANSRLVSTRAQLVRSEQLAAIGRLATGIAHEVKNHLSPFALADVIAREYPADGKIREAAEMMREAHQHILDLVNEIRSFASGGREYERAPHDVVEVIGGVLHFLSCDPAVRRAEIELEAKDRPFVDLDPRSFRQVLINLIKNAVDALPERGGRIRIRVREQDGQAMIDVADNGAGIPADIAPHIFEPFFSTKGDRGLGLGLDISREIILAHSGSLTFASEPGTGTTFRVTMPLSAGAASIADQIRMAAETVQETPESPGNGD